MNPLPRTRRPLIVLAQSLALLALAAIAPPADASSACNPSGGGASAFCVDASMSLAPTVAAGPFDTDVTVANASPNYANDKTRWLDTAVLDLTENSITTPPTLTRSANMPDGLLISGGGPCTTPNYTDCGAGHGTLVAYYASCCGSTYTTGAFGISKIVNVNPPSPGEYAHLEITIEGCVNVLGSCFEFPGGLTEELAIPEPSGGGAPDLTLTIDAHGTVGAPGGTVEYSIGAFSLHLDGESSSIDGGSPLPAPVRIFSAPTTCGTVSGSTRFTSTAVAPLTVSLPQSFSVTGCPTASLGAVTDGATSTFSAAGSGATTPGRTLKTYRWNFGDGHSATTTTPTTSHTYSSSGPRTAALVVGDSAGALSAPDALQVNPVAAAKTKTKVEGKLSGGRIKVKGKVKHGEPGAKVKLLLEAKVKGGFDKADAGKAKLKGAGKFKDSFDDPKGVEKCLVIAKYKGTEETKASKGKDSFKC
jgi:hypothetical protein